MIADQGHEGLNRPVPDLAGQLLNRDRLILGWVPVRGNPLGDGGSRGILVDPEGDAGSLHDHLLRPQRDVRDVVDRGLVAGPRDLDGAVQVPFGVEADHVDEAHVVDRFGPGLGPFPGIRGVPIAVVVLEGDRVVLGRDDPVGKLALDHLRLFLSGDEVLRLEAVANSADLAIGRPLDGVLGPGIAVASLDGHDPVVSHLHAADLRDRDLPAGDLDQGAGKFAVRFLHVLVNLDESKISDGDPIVILRGQEGSRGGPGDLPFLSASLLQKT